MTEQDQLQEHHWLTSIAQGDEVAFTELVKKYDNLVFVFINNIVKDAETAEELVNDIFIKVWLARESLAEIKNINTYLFVISRNYALNSIRNRIRQKRCMQNLPEISGEASFTERENKALDLIDEAVLHLPVQRRKVWEMSRREGKSYDDIGVELGVTKNTVKTQLRMANKMIMEYVVQRMDIPVIVWLLLR